MELDLAGSWRRKFFSPALLCLERAVHGRLKAVAHGSLLDVGCGVMPYRSNMPDAVSEYQSLDVEKRAEKIDFHCDVQNMEVVETNRYDTVLCTEVLEHVPKPDRVIAEIRRVLKPEGHLILTVPYLSRLHEEPYDYFRFTRHGIQLLLEQHDLNVVEIVPTGSLFSFLGHQVSTLVVLTAWNVPILRYLIFLLNAVLCTLPCYYLDQWLAPKEKLPLGYVAVANKASDLG